MSSVYIIGSIVLLLAVLACYAFVSQTLALRKQHRDKLQAALSSKVRNFKHMLNGFPPGFLPKDLTGLVLRSLVDMYEQLIDLDAENALFKQELQLASQQLNEVQRQHKPAAATTIDNHQQLKDAKNCLEELHKFVFQLEEKGALNRTQAEGHRNLIKQLVLQVTVDGYLVAGRQAKQAGKTRLALHYFDLAHKLLSKESKAGAMDKKIVALSQIMQELNDKLREEEPQNTATNAPVTSAAARGAPKTEESWKKKQVYD